MWGTLVKSSLRESLRQRGPWILLLGIVVSSGVIGLLPVRLGDPWLRHSTSLLALQRFMALLFGAMVAIPSLTPTRFSYGALRWGPPPWSAHMASHALGLGQIAALTLLLGLCTLAHIGTLLVSGDPMAWAPWWSALGATWLYGWGSLALARVLGAWLPLRQALGAFLALALLAPMIPSNGGEVTGHLAALLPGPSWVPGEEGQATPDLSSWLLGAAAGALFIVACNLLVAQGLERYHMGAGGLDRRNSKA